MSRFVSIMGGDPVVTVSEWTLQVKSAEVCPCCGRDLTFSWLPVMDDDGRPVRISSREEAEARAVGYTDLARGGVVYRAVEYRESVGGVPLPADPRHIREGNEP